jgi:hypothetical protein
LRRLFIACHRNDDRFHIKGGETGEGREAPFQDTIQLSNMVIGVRVLPIFIYLHMQEDDIIEAFKLHQLS